MLRMNTTHVKYAAPAALVVAAAFALPLGAQGANDASSQSPQPLPSTQSPSSSQGAASTQSSPSSQSSQSSGKGSASAQSARHQGKGKVSKKAKSGSDQAMADRVSNALSSDPSLGGATILVIVDGGQVALDGTTADPQQSAHAMQVAQEAAGPAVLIVDDLQPAAVVIAPAMPGATPR
jgi:osmotically-inducible protein OsmY